MSDFSVGINETNAEQCRKLLTQLPGIFAAGLRFEDHNLVEIHILASTERNPKQVSRDIQSALFAAYGYEIDHRIISIAQLPADPFQPAEKQEEQQPAEEHSSFTSVLPVKDVRLLFKGIDSQLTNGVYHITVHLEYNGKTYDGTAHCRDTHVQYNRSVAQATINAIHAFLGDDPFSLLDVHQTKVCGDPIDMTVVEYFGANTSLVLIGTALQPENISVGIVRSTLDALNRCISKLYIPH